MKSYRVNELLHTGKINFTKKMMNERLYRVNEVYGVNKLSNKKISLNKRKLYRGNELFTE